LPVLLQLVLLRFLQSLFQAQAGVCALSNLGAVDRESPGLMPCAADDDCADPARVKKTLKRGLQGFCLLRGEGLSAYLRRHCPCHWMY
jgi:hypothetical protein